MKKISKVEFEDIVSKSSVPRATAKCFLMMMLGKKAIRICLN